MVRTLVVILFFAVLGCSGPRYRPCSEGGEPPREKPAGDDKIDKRQCEQIQAAGGKPLNQGRYREWYWNGKLAIEGEYKNGKRHGKWFEYDETGKILTERWFEEGSETQTRVSKRPPGVPPAELPPATQPTVVKPADRESAP